MSQAPTPQNLWLNGFEGRMGQSLRKLLLDDQRFELMGGSSEQRIYLSEQGSKQEEFRIETWSEARLKTALQGIDIIIDFTSPQGSLRLCQLLKSQQLTSKSVLIGTTGLGEKELKAWLSYSSEHGGRLLLAPNTSLGVYLLVKMAQNAASVLRPQGFDIEIMESHHRHKIDSPSGTAKFIAEILAEQERLKPCFERHGPRGEDEIGVFALRGGSVFGEHEVRFMGELEELSLSHRALSRQLFAKGALKLAAWLSQAPGPKTYKLIDIPIDEMAN